MNSEERKREKERSRRVDEEDLASGRKSLEQLRAENGHFSRVRVRVNLASARALS